MSRSVGQIVPWVVLTSIFLVASACGQASSPQASEASIETTIKVVRDGKTFYGKPLATDGKRLAVIRWDGRLETFPTGDREIKVSRYSDQFKPYSTDELRKRLKKYFGNRYNISTTDHFVVIHPVGSAEFWAEPFESHYIKLKKYFETHGLKLEEPKFPLVAIILRTRQEFDRRLDAEADFNRSITGYYSRDTNRITTYDPTGRHAKIPQLQKEVKTNWIYSNPTIIHETAHQIAFNCGIHNRFSTVPKWVSEGLAMLCETPGIYDFKSSSKVTDRINRQRLKSLRKFMAKGGTEGKLLELIQHDRTFDTDAELAYAVSWGISFYLHESRQEAYFDFLRSDGNRRNFRRYDHVDRASSFIKHFGNDIAGLEKKMRQFIRGLP